MSTTSWTPALTALIGAGAAILGWPIVHFFNLRREIAAERRKLRVTYLLEAYRRLENSSNRPNGHDSDHAQAIESAIADIQLLGTPSQVSLAQSFAADFANNGNASLNPVLRSLRASLRTELELESVDDTMKFLRIDMS